MAKRNRAVKALTEKEPSTLAGVNGSDSSDMCSSKADDTTKNLINQAETFADYREEDPVEPENPKEVTGKYWCFVLYPESAPENWQELLNRSGLPWAVSPLHENDLNADNSKKKAHYHVIIIWANSTTYNAVKKFTQGTLNGTVPQVLHSPLGYYRYFTHEDNPEKYQYDKADIQSGNGFDIADYAKMTKQQKLELHMKLSELILEHGIYSYAEAVQMAMSMGFDEYEMVTSHTIHFTNLCKSVGYAKRKELEE